jgi:hypothetical protein
VQIVLAQSADTQGLIDLAAPHTALYYACHALSILAVLFSGLLALVSGRWNQLPLSARLAALVLGVTGCIWAAVAYPLQDIFSTTIIGATGPFVWLTLVFLLVGTDARVRRMARITMHGLTWATTLLGLVTLLRVPQAAYSIGLSVHNQYAILLTWLAGWSLMDSARATGWRLVLGLAPFAVLLPLDITSQSRSWTLLGFLLLAAFFWLRYRELGWKKTASLAGIFAGAAVLAVSFVALASPQIVIERVATLTNRVGDDTRSGQYEDFFNDVKPGELILGRGPKGTWNWTDVGDYQFFDNGLLWMLFIGGIPTLAGYVVLVLWPAVRMALAGIRGDSAPAAVMVLLWAIAMSGISTFTLPSVSLISFLVSLWAGEVHEALRKRQASSPQPQLSPAMAGAWR